MDLMIESLPKLLNATKLTIQLTLLSLFFGIFVGVFFAILRTGKNKFFYYIAYFTKSTLVFNTFNNLRNQILVRI